MKDNTRNILNEVDKRVSQKLRKAALMVERTAKQMCPVLTGTLKRSIISNWYGAAGSRSVSWSENKKKGIKAGKTKINPQSNKRAVIGTNIEYARRIELGFTGKDKLGRHYNQAAKPYLRPALEANMAAIKRLFKAK